jgi:lipoyl(octanoyl) transferase
MRKLLVSWLGRIPYRACWDLQRSLVEAVRSGRPDHLLLLEHEPVFTMGRRGDQAHLRWSEEECRRHGVEVVWSDRGGDATYHGPGQLVGYPIIDLARLGIDVITYIRKLETSLIDYLAGIGIAAEPGGKGMTGVWSSGTPNGNTEKVAAIGVKLTRMITSHGFALNLTTDLEVFNQGIVPCGLDGKRATSVAALGGPRIIVKEAALAYVPHIARTLGVDAVWADPAELHALPSAPPPETTLPVVRGV